MEITSSLPLILTFVFLLCVATIIVHNKFSMFLKRHGRKHSITGMAYFLWISGGLCYVGYSHFLPTTTTSVTNNPYTPFLFQLPSSLSSTVGNGVSWLLFDVVLGILGTVLTLFAAFEFKHKNVKNFASGTLDEHATVTYAEMIEHSFYQGLNLIQILYIHSFSFFPTSSSISTPLLLLRFLLLFLVTLPWYWRGTFPVNKFSDNYNKIDEKSTTLIRLLYRLKKYQYVFYKNFLLHGLNISLFLSGRSLGTLKFFRLYWLLLNLSYVMEFFLQTLVKKDFLRQSDMLLLQQVLMTASSIVGAVVLKELNWIVCFASLALNFWNRKHDLFNTMFIALTYTTLSQLPLPQLLGIN